jgi:ABC-type dipeptide/oligopeptide/nickel transport system permease subunit
VLGTTVGLIAAYYGGRIEAMIMRIIDLQLSLPAILLALVLVAMLGQGLMQLVAALVRRNMPISPAPPMARRAPSGARTISRRRSRRRCRRAMCCFAISCRMRCRR